MKIFKFSVLYLTIISNMYASDFHDHLREEILLIQTNLWPRRKEEIRSFAEHWIQTEEDQQKKFKDIFAAREELRRKFLETNHSEEDKNFCEFIKIKNDDFLIKSLSRSNESISISNILISGLDQCLPGELCAGFLMQLSSFFTSRKDVFDKSQSGQAVFLPSISEDFDKKFPNKNFEKGDCSHNALEDMYVMRKAQSLDGKRRFDAFVFLLKKLWYATAESDQVFLAPYVLNFKKLSDFLIGVTPFIYSDDVIKETKHLNIFSDQPDFNQSILMQLVSQQRNLYLQKKEIKEIILENKKNVDCFIKKTRSKILEELVETGMIDIVKSNLGKEIEQTLDFLFNKQEKPMILLDSEALILKKRQSPKKRKKKNNHVVSVEQSETIQNDPHGNNGIFVQNNQVQSDHAIKCASKDDSAHSVSVEQSESIQNDLQESNEVYVQNNQAISDHAIDPLDDTIDDQAAQGIYISDVPHKKKKSNVPSKKIDLPDQNDHQKKYEITYTERFIKELDGLKKACQEEIFKMIGAFHEWVCDGFQAEKLLKTEHGTWEYEKLKFSANQGIAQKEKQKNLFGQFAVKSREHEDMEFYKRVYLDVEDGKISVRYYGHINKKTKQNKSLVKDINKIYSEMSDRYIIK